MPSDDVDIRRQTREALERAREAVRAERMAKPNGSGRAQPRSLNDFYAYMPMHMYIFVPSGELWPASSVNARVPPVADGADKISATLWLDRHKPIEQMTWCPGFSMLIKDRLVVDGGWIKHPDVTCFNQYRPPQIKAGDAAKADPWLDHIHKIYPNDAKHIIVWLGHRVQRPQEKINHALVLGGASGIGKDTLLEPVKHAVGPWNFREVTPANLLGRFNSFVKAVILRVNEGRDLGDAERINRFSFYDHTKIYTAAPPDVLRVDEKHLREYYVFNVLGFVLTTNYKTDGIYLPADDRRHFVAWSDCNKEDFQPKYWNDLWGWYEREGYGHVAAYLAGLDISAFDPKAPPRKTSAFWDIVDASRALEDAELADVLEELGNPAAVTITQIANKATGDFEAYLRDRKNRKAIRHRLENCGYTPVRNDHAKDGLWKINGKRQAVYAKASLSERDRLAAVSQISEVSGSRSPSIDPLPSSSSPSAETGARARMEGDSEPLTSPTSLTGKSPAAKRSGRRCDHRGSAIGTLNPYDWPPDNPTRTILLHERCEAPWYDSGGAPEGVR